MTTVRALSYNIRSLRDDRAALMRVIRACDADLVCLQEAPRLLNWRARRRALAARTGLTPAAGRRPAGLAVLAGPRARRVHAEYHLLTRIPGLHRRGLALAVLEIDGARVIAACTHLDLAEDARRTHTAEVIGLLERARRRFQAPVVLGGDINEEPGGPSWDLLTSVFTDAYAAAPRGPAPTFSARRPRRRIDAIFTDPGIEVIGCGVPSDAAPPADYTRATDHLPVLADLRLPNEPQN
ncbi:Metal-dependent hydrolase, endonuclease/exonuclease/phosphatase family [Thermomonospora echinospora]|uniref:Metal-dependent hydrolase, endonuclease/exonuclease/phosphatase family n=1 Tax=Thermomonospora echinospora TaxID=1992 RepID=A0A1H5S8R8_9ACTN|nr:endonuclease/exonuclease/phosphatase family protein [Thermomonospora echinospora]SEF46850.1 Metal-dependent hydrolase, endonuclease/exonuclease/phosphatase family [Thermomonospora echinospora]